MFQMKQKQEKKSQDLMTVLHKLRQLIKLRYQKNLRKKKNHKKKNPLGRLSKSSRSKKTKNKIKNRNLNYSLKKKNLNLKKKNNHQNRKKKTFQHRNQNQKSHQTQKPRTNHQKKNPLNRNNQKMAKAILMIYKAKGPNEKNKGNEINYKDQEYKPMINCKIVNRLMIVHRKKRNHLKHSYRRWGGYSFLVVVQGAKTMQVLKNDLL